MRESIVPMVKPRGGSNRDPSRSHRCDEFQPGNPRRVALQQSSPPLPRPTSSCNHNSRSSSQSQRTAYRDFLLCLTPKGSRHLNQRPLGFEGVNRLVCCWIYGTNGHQKVGKSTPFPGIWERVGSEFRSLGNAPNGRRIFPRKICWAKSPATIVCKPIRSEQWTHSRLTPIQTRSSDLFRRNQRPLGHPDFHSQFTPN